MPRRAPVTQGGLRQKYLPLMKNLFHLNFHRYTEASFRALLGLSTEEFLYVAIHHVVNDSRVSIIDFMLGLHFAKTYPKQHAGAATWKMSRRTHGRRCWIAVVVLGSTMGVTRMENRTGDHVEILGPLAAVTLHTDSSDFSIGKPVQPAEAKSHYTFKNRKFALR